MWTTIAKTAHGRGHAGEPPVIIVGVTGDVPELIHFAYQRTIAVKVVAVDDRVPLTIHRIRRQRGHQHLAAIVVGPVGRIPKGIKYAVYPPMPFIEILNGGIASGIVRVAIRVL